MRRYYNRLSDRPTALFYNISLYKFSAELKKSDIARKATFKTRMYLHLMGFE
ncbi:MULTISPECIES: hypothetical protein [unclassified Paenibacillus]|uniref:hypothetical protein n=1 Tax=unclassified Paenibacillus TaxID=185978 RepID=UPI003641295E